MQSLSLFTCLAVLWLYARTEAVGCEGETAMVKPDVRLQASIKEIVASVVANKESRAPKEAILKMIDLSEATIGRESQVLQQMLLFFADSNSTKEWEAFAIMYKMMDFSCRDKLNALAPLLKTENGRIRKMATELLHDVDYACLEEWLTSVNREKIAGEIIRYMYHENPGQALLILAKVSVKDADRRRTILWAEHGVSDYLWKREHWFTDAADRCQGDAVAELEKLSKDEAWWARLYVAEIMQQHSELYKAEIIERLKKDEHELVRKSVGVRD